METQTKSVVEILKQPECLALTQKLKNFISTSYQHPKPITSQRRATIKFLDSLYSDCVKLPIFKELSETPQGRLKIREGLEKLTTTKIHDLVFGAPMTDEPMVCAHFELKITEFTWVQERHLDLPFEITSKLSTASTELHKVADYRAPKDKLTILNNTLQIVVDIIQSNSGAAGNDQLLPVLVLLLLKCSPPKIISHIRYVIRFRSAEELNKGHNQYCLTSLVFLFNKDGRNFFYL